MSDHILLGQAAFLSYIDLGDAYLRLSRDQVLALMPSAAGHPLLLPGPTT